MNSKTRVLVALEVKEGKKQDVLNILTSLSEQAKKREGVLSHDLCFSTQNPNELLIDHLWSSKEMFDKHFNSPEATKVRETINRLLVKPLQIKTYTEIDK
ncbi:MAG: antibiotic biosynthesis monooxygenase [Candidatus Nitrosocosmicus sp.]